MEGRNDGRNFVGEVLHSQRHEGTNNGRTLFDGMLLRTRHRLLISVKRIFSPENMPLLRDWTELGVLTPELECPACLKKPSTTLFGRQVRSSCNARN